MKGDFRAPSKPASIAMTSQSISSGKSIRLNLCVKKGSMTWSVI